MVSLRFYASSLEDRNSPGRSEGLSPLGSGHRV